ncbi:cyclic nucleotide-binding domain-containing protein [Comamonadaceae bacterium G21597-S1]|nr:cyclic nucleotide-binding domain-containing protein [Comamonadaceae bacterium G21597-S1]
MAERAALRLPTQAELQLRAHFERAGLQIEGVCGDLSSLGEHWRQTAALLEDLTPAEADTLGALMPTVRARAGQALITQGEVGEWMLLLLEGTVDVVKRSEDTGESSRLAVVKEGASIGEMSMLDSAPRYASCIAIEDVRAGVLTREAIAHLIQDHPAIGAKILVKLTQLLAQRLRNTSNRLVKVLQHQEPDYTPD